MYTSEKVGSLLWAVGSRFSATRTFWVLQHLTQKTQPQKKTLPPKVFSSAYNTHTILNLPPPPKTFGAACKTHTHRTKPPSACKTHTPYKTTLRAVALCGPNTFGLASTPLHPSKISLWFNVPLVKFRYLCTFLAQFALILFYLYANE
jgi:hypothetical protein